ncbi:MAG: CRTAC1 family protein, partial [Acidobacteriota bacterium]
DLDLYLVNGAPLPGYKKTRPLTNAMYRNDGTGHFTDVTVSSGTGDTGYGMGICAGDYDNDGYTDFYLTNFGLNVLYRNNGDGSFEATTGASGAGSDLWSTSCAFLDYDRDGDLDLYVANYVDFAPDNNKYCGDYARNVRAYCHPNVYNGQPDVLYRNNGDGTFTDVSDQAGLTARDGNGLGVVTGDYDNDGDIDLYVANDKSPNVLYRNEGNGRFADVTLLAGVGYSVDGEPQAGMGTFFGDYDGDGDLDLVVTNLDFEYNDLYRNEGDGIFSDASFSSGVGAVSLSYVGFGVQFFDYDNDGRMDMAVANGHILDNAPYFNDATTYAQRPFLFRGMPGGRMQEVGLKAGPGLGTPLVGRGMAAGDIDGDGDTDLLITVCGGAPRLIRNDGGDAARGLTLRLVGRRSNRSALGARASLHGPHGPEMVEVRSGGSYLSQPDMRVHFGLGPDGPAGPARVTVRWPSGSVETFLVDPAVRFATLLEGEGSAR